MIYTVGYFSSDRVAAGKGLSSSDGSRCQNKRDKESVTLSLGGGNGTRCTCAQESGDDYQHCPTSCHYPSQGVSLSSKANTKYQKSMMERT